MVYGQIEEASATIFITHKIYFALLLKKSHQLSPYLMESHQD